MSLLVPETGLLFWMLLAFGVVFFVLAKYGWPVITEMVEKRSEFINQSVRSAEEANLQLENIKKSSENIIAEAYQKQMEILKEGTELKNKMIEDARREARAEADKIVAAANLSIQKEKEAALKDIRSQIATLSFDIAEKIIRQKMDNAGEQSKFVEKLLDEITISQS